MAGPGDKNMQHVIACIDGSDISSAVCEAAIWAAQRMNMPLTFVHILENHPMVASEDLSGAIGLGSQELLLAQLTEKDEKRNRQELEFGWVMLEKSREQALADGLVDVRIRQRHGDVLEALQELQEEARIFVLGRSGEGHDSTKPVLGAHLENALRSIQRPLLVTTAEFSAPSNFMVAYDGRETMDKAVQRTASSPLLQGIPCHLIMVVNELSVEKQTQLDRAKAVLQAEGFEVQASLIGGEVQSALADYQTIHGIQLLAMGAYGHSRVRQFFVGSNTSRMIAAARTPLLILK